MEYNRFKWETNGKVNTEISNATEEMRKLLSFM